MNKISEKKIKEIIEDLRKYKSLNNKKHKANYYYQARQNIIDSEHPIELIKEFLDIYSQCKRNVTIKEEIETDDRAITNVERDEEGKIQFYTFEIFKKDRPVFKGKLDRREMETIYNLYSTYNANLTGKIVSREFPQYSFVDFKRILHAFNIFKHDVVPQHLLEELSEEELIERHNRQKENNILRTIEKDEVKELKKLVAKLAKENKEYTDSKFLIKSLIEYNPQFKNDKPYIPYVDKPNTLIIWLSDLHIGGYNEKYGFFDLPDYNKGEILRRLEIVLNTFNGKSYDNVIVVDLGDSIDQYNKETTRGGHLLPNNMTDKEMSHLYFDCMEYFFSTLKCTTKSQKYYYYSIGESNHSGDFGWALNLALSYKLQQQGWETYVSNYPIDDFTIDNYTFLYTHGKNNYTQSRQFPLTLNPQTELYFANYIAEKNLFNDHIFVVKGDLHNYAYTSGKQFDYVSVGSLYATSNYIAANFGNTKWSVNYSIIEDGQISFGKITE